MRPRSPLLLRAGLVLASCTLSITQPVSHLSASVWAACPGDVVVLGADLNLAQRLEVTRRLGAPAAPPALYLGESLGDEQAQAGGLIPPSLLGVAAISSARLGRRLAGTGLTVKTDETVTVDTASIYANALLTAGVRDAVVQVAAPRNAPALGTTALLGLLRAARAACIAVPPARATLALRELLLTTHVADVYGAGPAADLLGTAKKAAAALTSPDAGTLGSIVDRAAGQAGTPLLATTRATLAGLLADIGAASHRYPDLAAPATVQTASRYLATVAPYRLAVPASPAPSPIARGTVLTGKATLAANGMLRGTFGGKTLILDHVVGHLVVTRNGQPAHLNDVQPGDRVTVHTEAHGRMVRLEASGPSPFPAIPAALSGVVTRGGTSDITYAVTNSGVVHDSPALIVTRNGREAMLGNLLPGDRIVVYRDAIGQPVRIDARSAPAAAPTALREHVLHGTAHGATAGTLTFVDSATVLTRTVSAAADARPVTRNGHSGLGLDSVRPGDGVTVVLDPSGAVRAVDAHSHGVPAAQAQGPAGPNNNWPLIALGALLALGLLLLVIRLLLLGLRLLPFGKRALPFALVQRRPGSQEDAAEPADCELSRRTRVLCTDGDVGRLAHVVVIPESGALLRLVMRDQDGVLHELPANLIASTSPTTVRLSVDQAEVQDLLEDHPAFSVKPYKALDIDQGHPPNDGVLIQIAPDSMQVSVDGAGSLS